MKQKGQYEFVGTRCIASAAQFIERNLDESNVEDTSDMISRDKSRGGRDTSGPYEFNRMKIGKLVVTPFL